MAPSAAEKRLSPVIILSLVAALVAVLGLWAVERAGGGAPTERGPEAISSTDVIEWKLVTTWPKNFPGLGSAAVNLSRAV